MVCGRVDTDGNIGSIGSMWTFEQEAQVSEYVLVEPGVQDHCVHLDDQISIPKVGTSIVGSELLNLLGGSGMESALSLEDVVDCKV